MRINFICLLIFPLVLNAFEAKVKRIEGPNIIYVSNEDGLRKITLYATKAFGNKQANTNSKNYLSSLILNQIVTIKQINPISSIVYLQAIDINQNMVERGFLLSNTKQSSRYFADEQEAKNKRFGNWGLFKPDYNPNYPNNHPNCSHQNCNPCYQNCQQKPRPKPPLCNQNNCNTTKPKKENSLSIDANININYNYRR